MSDAALTTHPAPTAMARAAYPSDERLSADQIGEAAAARPHYVLGRLRRLATDVEASLQTASAPMDMGTGERP